MPNRNFKYLYYFFWYASDKEERFGRPSVKLLMILCSLIVKNFLKLWRLFLFQVKQYKQTKKKKKGKLFLSYFKNLEGWNSGLVSWLPALVCRLSCLVQFPRGNIWRGFFSHMREFHPTQPADSDCKLHGLSVWFSRSSCSGRFSFTGARHTFSDLRDQDVKSEVFKKWG